MTYIREMIFGQELDLPKSYGRERILAILVIVLLFVLAWRFGILTSAALNLKILVGVIWNMLRDMASALGDFVQYIFGQRSH